jgi:RimJ/RimL family protein N-acetyltransferase
MPAFPIDRAHPPRRLAFQDPTRTLVLRPWDLDDVDPLIEAIRSSLPELRAFMPWAHLPITREGQHALIARFHSAYWNAGDYVLGMFDTSGRVLGGLGLHPRVPLNPSALEVGYWVRTSETGRGWATLAVQMSLVLAFDWFECDRVQVSHDEANAASRRVVEKCGFAFEGVIRNLVAGVPETLPRDGYLGTRRHRQYGLTSDDLATRGDALPWLNAVRAGLTVVDATGESRRGA